MIPTLSKFWPEEVKDQAIKLFLDGVSCSLIAQRINKDHGTSKSRNAVIGMLHRAGYGGKNGQERAIRKRLKAGRPTGHCRKSTARKPSHRLRFERVALPAEDKPPAKLFTMLEWPDTACKWPYGDPVRFGCTCARLPGLPYCAEHATRAYKVPVVTARKVYSKLTEFA